MHDLDSPPPSAAVRLQLEGEMLERVEDWRRSQRKIPSRSEAVRQLVECALADADGSQALECWRRCSASSIAKSSA
jgi:metal-responsive CopG/Arc/MetJ family transcriptional regulator